MSADEKTAKAAVKYGRRRELLTAKHYTIHYVGFKVDFCKNILVFCIIVEKNGINTHEAIPVNGYF